LPHPLDFDWRYDQQTTDRLADMLRGGDPVIALGAPSVARLLDRDSVAVTLVDRQPLQSVRRHIVCPVEDFDVVAEFRTAVVDPPWYPRQLRDWSRAAGRAVGIGGSVFVSVWPDHTRPGGAQELSTALVEISSWADIERNVEALRYAEPVFEVAARARGLERQLSRSPLVGELIRLTVRHLPQRDDRPQVQEHWLRFTVDDYQLALRLDVATAPGGIDEIRGAEGWQWPYVSARAPCRNQIGLWSSAGEVAAIGNPSVVAKTLRDAFLSPSRDCFERALATAPELLSWCIPRPPYRRSIEWQHRQ
jgi:hypothetical protein